MNTQELIAALRVFAGEGAQTNYARVVQRKAADAIESLQAENERLTEKWEENEIENGEQQSQIDKLTTERDSLQSQLDDYTVMMTAKRDALQARINELEAKTQPLTDDKKRSDSLLEMSLATIQALQAVSEEYNRWIRCHAAGGDYDDFLKAELKSATALGTSNEQ